MKKLLSILLVAMLIIGMFPVTPLTANAAGETYNLVTEVSEITAGGKFVIVANVSGAYKAIPLTLSSGKFVPVAVTVENNAIAASDSLPVWTIAATTTGTNTVSLNNGSAYLAYKSSTNFQTQSAAYDWKVAEPNSDNTFTIVSNATTRGVAYGISQNKFGAYATSNMSKTSEYVFYLQLYKLSGEGQQACDECTPASNEDAVAATCTATGLTNSFSCSVCGNLISAQETTPKLAHVYDNGVCSTCGDTMVDPAASAATLMSELPDAGDVIAIYNPSTASAMGAAVNSYGNLSVVLSELVDGKLPYDANVAQLTVGKVGDSSYTFQNQDGQYLSSDSDGGCLNFVDEYNDYCVFSFKTAGTDLWYINNANTTKPAVEIYNKAFTTYYTGTDAIYQMQLYLVKKNECAHESKTSLEDGYDATCTEAGKEDTYVCDDCEVEFPGAEIPALGHDYVNGTCTVCGDTVSTSGTVTITFDADKTQRTSYSTEAQVWTEGAITFTNNRANSSNDVADYSDPVRLYAGSEVVIACSGGVISSVVIESDGTAKYKTALETALTNANLTYTNDGNAYTVEFADAVESVTLALTAQARFKAVTVTYGADAPKPVAEVNGTEYTSMDDAVAEIAANGGTLKLLANAESITYDGELYLDLNGNNAANVTATKIYAYDSTVTTSSTEFATLATESTVEMDYTANGKRYIALKTEGGYTFHVLEMQLSAITLRHTEAGIYYKAKIVCDSTLAAATKTYGIALSTDNMPGKDFATETGDVNCYTAVAGAPESGKEFTSGSVFGIFKDTLSAANNAARGKIKIYANAYLVLNDGTNDTIVMADTSCGDADGDEGFNGIAWSLYDVMVALDATFNENTAAQERILSFYNHEVWHEAMADWGLTNIAAAA